MNPTVSVLVPVLDEAEWLRDGVETVLGQKGPSGGVEFLFIDGGSTDGSREIVEGVAAEDERVRLVDNPGREVVHALNLGLANARGAVIVRMDAHSRYPGGYLVACVERLARGDVAWVAGPQIARGDDRGSRCTAVALESRLGVGGADFRRSSDREFETDAAFTGAIARETLLSLGGWDGRWPVNEDGELAARVAEAGGVIVCLPELAAEYRPRGSLRALARQYWRYGIFRERTCRRHPASMRRSHLLPPGLVVCALVALTSAGAPARAARAGIGVYSFAVAAESARLGRARDVSAPALAATFVTMHASWGAGFFAGALVFGPPLRALALLFGRR